MLVKIHFFLLLAFVLSFGCDEKKFDPNDPEKSFVYAKEPYNEESYEIALQKLGEFKARFPYSQYATEAELLIANSHFELDQYIEAAAGYETFAKLHPKHPKVDYALFRVGESNWKEAPEEVDREQEYTKLAVESWRKLIQSHPKSNYAKQAETLINQGERRLAESDDFISKFYCKLSIYHACAARSLKLAESYPKFADLKRTALLRASNAFDELAKLKDADPKSDKNIYFKTMTSKEMQKKAADLRQQAGPEAK